MTGSTPDPEMREKAWLEFKSSSVFELVLATEEEKQIVFYAGFNAGMRASLRFFREGSH